MREFIRKFFGYYQYENEEGVLGLPEPFKDGLGKGAFSDIRHIIMLVLVISLCVILYRLFKKYPKTGKKTAFILVGIMLITRVVNQTVRAIIGAEDPAWRALPFHLCTMMSFVLPLVVIFKWDKLKTAVYTLSMMGGIVTLLLGEYFENQFLTFSAFEGIYAHTILILVPIMQIATDDFRFEFKKSWTVFLGIGILLLWATLANYVFFKDYDTNYMYLRKNGLPGNLGGDFYFLIYCVLFLIMYFLIFSIPTFYRKKKLTRV